MPNLYLDIETIPPIGEAGTLRMAELTEAADIPQPLTVVEAREQVKPPGNLKKAESIDKWLDAHASTEAAKLLQQSIDRHEAALDKLESKLHADGLNALYGEVWSIAWAIDEGEIHQMDRGSLVAATSEKNLLATFFTALPELLEAARPGASKSMPDLVGHNVAGFDIAFVWRRCVINGVKPIWWWPSPSTPPWKMHVYDTMLEWAGTRGTVKLEDLARAFGMQGKGAMDGSKVWAALQAGQHREVAEYNRHDVGMVRECHRRLTFGEAA